MPLFSAPGALDAALPTDVAPIVGDWELCELPDGFSLDLAYILIYEEMMDNTPENILNDVPKTGFGDIDRLPYVKKFHLVFAAENHIIIARCLRKVC